MAPDAPVGHYGGRMDMNMTSSVGSSGTCNNDSRMQISDGEGEHEVEHVASECCVTIVG